MSATRLLVLGVVRGYGRAHGYLVGNDLLSWGADEWANVKRGSIHHALEQLTKDEFLREGWVAPGRTDHEVTERGEAEFMRLPLVLAEIFYSLSVRRYRRLNR
jgi:DNA-binding PadR family transcriptional regulator